MVHYTRLESKLNEECSFSTFEQKTIDMWTKSAINRRLRIRCILFVLESIISARKETPTASVRFITITIHDRGPTKLHFVITNHNFGLIHKNTYKQRESSLKACDMTYDFGKD